MQDIPSLVAQLRRPRLLVRAARLGVEDYNRTLRLPRLLPECGTPRPGEAILRLLEVEAELESQRRAGAAAYPVARHVEVVIALLGEVRLLRAAQREAAPLTVV